MSSDLTFIMNEEENTVRDRLAALLAHTRQFDVLVDYSFISGFHRVYHDLEHAEKVRILVGLRTDRATFRALQDAQRELVLMSHAETREAVPQMILDGLERSEDTPRRPMTARS